MKAYQRFSKAYRLIDSNGRVVGEYTTVGGAQAAAKRKRLKDAKIVPIK